MPFFKWYHWDQIITSATVCFLVISDTISKLQIKNAVLGIHGVDAQSTGISFLECLVFSFIMIITSFCEIINWFCNMISVIMLLPYLLLLLAFENSVLPLVYLFVYFHILQVSEFSPSTSTAMGLPAEFHQQCSYSFEMGYLKVFHLVLSFCSY